VRRLQRGNVDLHFGVVCGVVANWDSGALHKPWQLIRAVHSHAPEDFTRGPVVQVHSQLEAEHRAALTPALHPDHDSLGLCSISNNLAFAKHEPQSPRSHSRFVVRAPGVF
jgi:hypothetical protein